MSFSIATAKVFIQQAEHAVFLLFSVQIPETNLYPVPGDRALERNPLVSFLLLNDSGSVDAVKMLEAVN